MSYSGNFALESDAFVECGWIVRGMVQGVGFRWWTHREAKRVGIVGLVRNRSDGGVEIMARATADQLERFEKSIRRGPPMSDVERLEVVTCILPAESDGFTIER